MHCSFSVGRSKENEVALYAGVVRISVGREGSYRSHVAELLPVRIGSIDQGASDRILTLYCYIVCSLLGNKSDVI